MRPDELIDKLGNKLFFLRDRAFKARGQLREMMPSGGNKPQRGSVIDRIADVRSALTGGQALELLKQHQWAICAIAIAGIAFATVPGALRASDAPDSTTPAPVWFYDLTTGKQFEGAPDAIAPIAAPSGKADAGVRAHVFTCGSCRDVLQTRLGYLEKYTSEARNALQTLASAPDLTTEQRAEQLNMVAEGTLVGTIDGKHWYPLRSVNGEKVVRAARKPCENRQTLSECDPLSP